MTGRSHNVAAQATTLGKRFATVADELLVALEPARRPARPLPAARHQGPDRHRPGHARPARRRRRAKLAELEQRVAAPPRLRARARPASARSTRARSTSTWSPRSCSCVAGPSNLATTIRLMAGNELVTEGFKAGQVGSIGDAAQDEHPLLRAGQRPRRRPARLPLDGRRAGRRPVERGRRLLLGRAPGRAARRVLRPRRAVRDVPDRARRVRRVPGGDRSASSTATCRS